MRSAIKTGVVAEFRGEYYFLSNYYTAPFQWRGYEFQSGEQAFAYAKTFFAVNETIGDSYRRKIYGSETPGVAKKHGRAVTINVAEWDAMRVQYMREIVHAKFATAGGGIVGQLLNTGAMLLVEGNDWGDKFWGRCLDKATGKMVGLNTLGTILMEERGYWLHHEL